MAREHGWLPTEVDAQDPGFVEEYLAYLDARAEASERERARQDRESRHHRFDHRHG